MMPREDARFYHRLLSLGMRRVVTALGDSNLDPAKLSKKRLIALLGFAYALGADDTAETAAKVGVQRRPDPPPPPCNVVPLRRRKEPLL